MVTNRRCISQEGQEFYPTPVWGTNALLSLEKFTGSILEPCCGDGAIAEVLKKMGYQVIASDICDRGYGRQQDFLDRIDPIDNIITNPPFNLAEAILAHALRLARRKVALLLRTAFLESRGRYERVYAHNPPARMLVFSERLSMYPHGHPPADGGTTSYSWFVWDKSDASGRTEVKWIPPGLKAKYRHPVD
jgi:hypothetical protein